MKRLKIMTHKEIDKVHIGSYLQLYSKSNRFIPENMICCPRITCKYTLNPEFLGLSFFTLQIQVFQKNSVLLPTASSSLGLRNPLFFTDTGRETICVCHIQRNVTVLFPCFISVYIITSGSSECYINVCLHFY